MEDKDPAASPFKTVDVTAELIHFNASDDSLMGSKPASVNLWHDTNLFSQILHIHVKSVTKDVDVQQEKCSCFHL